MDLEKKCYDVMRDIRDEAAKEEKYACVGRILKYGYLTKEEIESVLDITMDEIEDIENSLKEKEIENIKKLISNGILQKGDIQRIIEGDTPND